MGPREDLGIVILLNDHVVQLSSPYPAASSIFLNKNFHPCACLISALNNLSPCYCFKMRAWLNESPTGGQNKTQKAWCEKKKSLLNTYAYTHFLS